MSAIIVAGGGGGKGGGGQAPRAPIEAPNTLRSKQIAHVIDLLGEGEWEGLVDGPGGIYLNGVPLFNPNVRTDDVVDVDLINSGGAWPIAGTWNFQGVSVEFKPGTQGQAAIRAASSASAIVAVNQLVVFSTPVVAAISNPEFDLAIVAIQVDSLFFQNTNNGDVTGYYVAVKIEVQPNGGSYLTVVRDVIQGKAMSAYVRNYSIDLASIGPGPYNVKVTRESPDASLSNVADKVRFVSVSAMNREKYRYPNSVLVSIGIDSSQMTAVPSRSYDCKMMRVRVPVNYDPIAHSFSGVWDGTFKIAWTDDPVWCMYEMATNSRFGLGDYFDDTLLDKWTLYTISQYCNETVPDGYSGFEPRFTMNVYFQTSEEAITLIQNMCSVFRSIIYYLSEKLIAVQDAPADPVYAFTRANVIDGKFNYAGASASARHTVAMVVWNNPELNYEQDIEYVEDIDGILKYGYRPTTVAAMGCTSRGQAHRLGAWTLYTEQNESDIVNFATGLEGTGIQPGKIIEIYDPVRAGARMGGRIIGVSGSDITIDKAITLPAGTHTVSYIGNGGQLYTRTTTVAAGTTAVLTLVGSDPMPAISSIFGVKTSVLVAQLYRIVSIIEDGKKYSVSAVAHDPGKYAAVENGLQLTSRPTSVVSVVRPAVANVKFDEALYVLNDGTFGIRLSISWDQDQLATGYIVSYKRNSESWTPEKMVMGNELVLNPVSEGWTYYFKIYAMSMLGKKGVETPASHLVLGEKFPPPKFDYFLATVQPDGTRQFDFGYTVTEKPADFKGARIRYFQGVTTDWDTMTPLENEGFYPVSPMETNLLLSGSYTLAARAEDFSQSLSDPFFISVTLPDRRLGSVLAEFNEFKDLWAGTFTNCHLDTLSNFVEANDTATWATLPATWALWTRWNVTPASPIQYVTIARDMVSTITGLLEINVTALGSVTSELRTSPDGVTWSAWGPANVSFTSRFFQLRITVTATGPAPIPTIMGLIYSVGGKVKKESLNDVNIAAYTGANRIGVGDVRVKLSNTYSVISRVTMMAIQDPNPGWEWILVDRSTSGPRIKFYKNSVLADPALVDFYIEGY